MFVPVVILLLLCGSSATQAAVCYVSSTGNANITDCTDMGNPCLGFKFAIESAVPVCTEVNAFAGTYIGSDNQAITASLPLVLQAFNESVVVDLQGVSRFLFVTGAFSTITNFTFVMKDMEVRSGRLAVNNARGGAVSIEIANDANISSVSPCLFQNVRFINNTLTARVSIGGALFVQNMPSIIRNSTLTDNNILCNELGGPSCFGGAIGFSRSAGSISDYLIEDSLFMRNRLVSTEDDAASFANGGAISFGGFTSALDPVGTAIFRRSSFIDNSVSQLGIGNDETRGGAIASFGLNTTIECDVGFEELCTFSGNRLFSASTTGNREIVGGGAVSVHVGTSPPNVTFLTIRNAVFYNNSVSCTNPTNCSNEFGGGALSATRIDISGCSFCNNSAFQGNGSHILVAQSMTDMRELNAGPLPNIFTCNATGPAIEPLSFQCEPPVCLFPSAVVVDPATDICSPCQLVLTPTPTSNFLSLCNLFFALALVGLDGLKSKFISRQSQKWMDFFTGKNVIFYSFSVRYIFFNCLCITTYTL